MPDARQGGDAAKTAEFRATIGAATIAAEVRGAIAIQPVDGFGDRAWRRAGLTIVVGAAK